MEGCCERSTSALTSFMMAFVREGQAGRQQEAHNATQSQPHSSCCWRPHTACRYAPTQPASLPRGPACFKTRACVSHTPIQCTAWWASGGSAQHTRTCRRAQHARAGTRPPAHGTAPTCISWLGSASSGRRLLASSRAMVVMRAKDALLGCISLTATAVWCHLPYHTRPSAPSPTSSMSFRSSLQGLGERVGV